MTIVQSFSTCLFKKYLSTQGRASPSEYWWFVFFTGLVHFGINISVTNYIWEKNDIAWYHVFHLGVAIFLGLPWFAVAVRRMHDIDQPEFLGWLGALASLSCVYSSALIVGGIYALMETSINDVQLVLIIFIAVYYALFCIVMGFVFFVLSVMDGKLGANKHGPNPLSVEGGNNFQPYGPQGFTANQGQNWGPQSYAQSNAQSFAQSNAQQFAQANGQPYQPYSPRAAHPTNYAANQGYNPSNIQPYQGFGTTPATNYATAPAQPSYAQQFSQVQPIQQSVQQGYNAMPPQSTMPSQMAPDWPAPAYPYAAAPSPAPAQNSMVQPLAAPAAIAQATAAAPEFNQQVGVPTPAPTAFNAQQPDSNYQNQLTQALAHPEVTPQVKLNAAELNQMDYVELTQEQSQQLQAMWRAQAQNTTNQP